MVSLVKVNLYIMTICIQYEKIIKILDIHEDEYNARLTVKQRDEIAIYRNDILLSCLEGLEKLEIENNAYGKPIVINYPQLAFNQSHSQHYYALAYSLNVLNLGIDIEDFSRNIRMLALAEHCFHTEEIKKWEETKRDKLFWLKVWTTKEAVLKAHGLGIRLDLKTVNTNIVDGQDFGIIQHEQLGIFRYHNFQLEKSMMTVAYEDTGFNWDVIFK